MKRVGEAIKRSRDWAKINKPSVAALLAAIIIFALFCVFYLDSRIHGDQLGLWSYISTNEHQNPFALWSARASGGASQSLNPEYNFLDVTYFIELLFKDIILRSNVINAVTILMLGAGIFLLTRHITKNFNAALIGGVFAGIASGATIRSIGNNPYFFAMAYMPLIFYFLLLVLERPRYLHAFLLALSLTFMILAGGIGSLMWMVFFMPFFFAAYFLLFFNQKLLARQMIFLALAFILFALFSLFKIWGGFVYINDADSRPGAQPYNLFLQGTGSPKEFIPKLISIVIPGPQYDDIGLWVGPIGLALVVLSLWNFRKRHYALFGFMVLISILVVSDTFITHLAHQVPYLNRTKDVVKSLFLFGTFIGILGAYGYLTLDRVIRAESVRRALPALIMVLLFVQFGFFFILFPRGISDDSKGVGEILAKDTFFKDIDSSGVPYRLVYQDLTGGRIQIRISESNIDSADWIHGNGFSRPYLVYKQVAMSTRPAELLGLLNVKYIYSTQPNAYPLITQVKSDPLAGQYLYRNERFLPRYRMVSDAVLVADDDVRNPQAAYFLLSRPDVLNVSSAVLISAPLWDEQGLLPRYDSIFLTKQPETRSIGTLQSYAQSGGVILPIDIFGAKNVSYESYLPTLSTPFETIASESSSPDHLILHVPHAGWVVLSETYATYSGWQANQNGRPLRLYMANGINTAVYAESAGDIRFDYRPAAFTTGAIISATAFVLALLVFIVPLSQKKRSDN